MKYISLPPRRFDRQERCITRSPDAIFYFSVVETEPWDVLGRSGKPWDVLGARQKPREQAQEPGPEAGARQKQAQKPWLRSQAQK